MEAELGLPASQVLALFSKAMRKLYAHLRAAKEAAVERTLPKVSAAAAAGARLVAGAGDVGMDAELEAAAAAVRDEMKVGGRTRGWGGGAGGRWENAFVGGWGGVQVLGLVPAAPCV